MSTCFSSQLVADEWFDSIAAFEQLPVEVVEQLDDDGFVIIPGPIPSNRTGVIAQAYDYAVANADPTDVSHGSTTTRVHDMINRTSEFDQLCVYLPLLKACCLTLNQPFKLSTMLARTVRPHSTAQTLHVDFPREGDGWPMVGFIFMVDDFRPDNGATRFVRGSHKWISTPEDLKKASGACDSQSTACSPAGSLIVYNGSIWHGHGANSSDMPRRSVQGSFVRRDAASGSNLTARLSSDTLARISPLAKYLLAIEEQHA